MGRLHNEHYCIITLTHSASEAIVLPLGFQTSLTIKNQPPTQEFLSSLRKQPTFGNTTTGLPAKWHLRNKHRNSILMMINYPDLISASDWSCRLGNLIQPIRSTTHNYLGSDVSSVWNFCPRFSDIIWLGNQWQHRQMSVVFSGYFLCKR